MRRYNLKYFNIKIKDLSDVVDKYQNLSDLYSGETKKMMEHDLGFAFDKNRDFLLSFVESMKLDNTVHEDIILRKGEDLIDMNSLENIKIIKGEI